MINVTHASCTTKRQAILDVRALSRTNTGYLMALAFTDIAPVRVIVDDNGDIWETSVAIPSVRIALLNA